MGNIAIILTSDYNLKASKCVISVPDECFIIDNSNEVQYISLIDDKSCRDAVGYKVVTNIDGYYQYEKSPNRYLIEDIIHGKYKVVCGEHKIGGKSWRFEELPLSRVFYFRYDGLSEQEISKVKTNIIDTINMEVFKDNTFADINSASSRKILLDLVEDARNEVINERREEIQNSNTSNIVIESSKKQSKKRMVGVLEIKNSNLDRKLLVLKYCYGIYYIIVFYLPFNASTYFIS